MDNKKFHVGDIVRSGTNCGDAKRGEQYLVEENDDGALVICKGDDECTCDEDWTLVEAAKGKKGKQAKEVPISFVLQYDKDEDPIELFRTMKEVKARVAHLVENDRYVKRDSFKVYTIKGLPKTIKVSTSVTLSK